MPQELKQSAATLKEEEGRLARDGYVSALRSLNAHVGIVSSVSWKDALGSESWSDEGAEHVWVLVSRPSVC